MNSLQKIHITEVNDKCDGVRYESTNICSVLQQIAQQVFAHC